MKNKTLLLVLALVVLAAASAWAQVPTTGPVYGTIPTNGPTTSTTGAGPAFNLGAQPCAKNQPGCTQVQDPPVTGPVINPGSSGALLDVLGGHGSRGGCMFCHTPHSTGRLDATATVAFSPTGKIAGGPYGTETFTWAANSVGNQVSGNIYLWNRAITTVTYKTWDGGTFSSATATGPDRPEVHSLLCMTCHDNSMSSYAMTASVGTQHGGWGAPGPGMQFTSDPNANPPYTNKIGTTPIVGGPNYTSQDPGTTALNISNGAMTFGQGDLSRNHPVHAKYSGSSLWKVTINADHSVSYVDADTNQIGDSGFYGHPARLYSDGTSVYVECTSCHNPHRQTSPAYKAANGTYVVGAFGTTENYIRGPFSADDGTISAGFCRSCHYSKSPEYVRNNGVSK